MAYDIVIENGLYFDGNGAPGRIAHVGIRDGVIRKVSATPLDGGPDCRRIDATDRWITPGFIEPHSHYDAEVIIAPELSESVRHGVTTVMTGICSISMVCAEAEDCSDLFTRVEAVPREQVLPLLKEKKTWRRPREFREFFEQHPLGPNLAAFVGHSDLRAAAMGLVRSASKEQPTEAELQQMEDLLREAMEAGFLGMSSMTTRLDRLDGDRAWAKPLPSTYARWSEYRRLHRVLREYDRVLQSAPDAVGKVNVFAFLWESIGWMRRPLKITLLTALDLKSQPYLHIITPLAGWVANTFLGANLRWQFLPSPFLIYAYGLDFNSFGELQDARILRDFKDPTHPYEEAQKPEFRAILRKDMKSMLTAGLWHRDFSDAWVVECPDRELVGRNFKEIGDLQNKDPVDAFLDLAIQYRRELRWGIQFGGDRTAVMRKLCRSRQVHVGFADSGAHLENLASYNFPLCMLKHVLDAQKNGEDFMRIAHAVHRLTGELGDWYGIDAGHIREGDRADVVVINPAGLGDEVWQMTDALFPAFDMKRLVNRNDDAVDYTLINGRIAYSRLDGFAAQLGRERGFGRFLPARGTPADRPATVGGSSAQGA